MDLVVVECKASKKMIIFIVLLIFLVVWVSLVMFAKQEAKSLLSKCGAPLPWIRSNSIIMMVRKLQELKEKLLTKNLTKTQRNIQHFCLISTQ